ncbi:MAG TPA: hypothetical protein PLJ00_15775 [Chitinophagales bacterium]|nr:hypothetical protein [Chitinophagales bacterium]
MLYFDNKHLTGTTTNLQQFKKRYKIFQDISDGKLAVAPGSYLHKVVMDRVKAGKIKQCKKLPNVLDKVVYRPPAVTKKPKRKITGERALFREIIAERGARSEISGEPLITDENNKFWVNQFLHILPKSNYPECRLLKENIMLGTKEEHDVQTKRPDKIKNSPKWAVFFAKYEELRMRFNN